MQRAINKRALHCLAKDAEAQAPGMRRGAEPAVRIELACKAKVGELNVAGSIQQQVFRLEIPASSTVCQICMYVAVSMAVPQTAIVFSHKGNVIQAFATSAGPSWLDNTRNPQPTNSTPCRELLCLHVVTQHAPIDDPAGVQVLKRKRHTSGVEARLRQQQPVPRHLPPPGAPSCPW